MLRFASRQIAADYVHEFEQLFEGALGRANLARRPFRCQAQHPRYGLIQPEAEWLPALNLSLMRVWYNCRADTAVVGITMPFTCASVSAPRVSLDSSVSHAACSKVGYEEGTGSNE